MTNNSTCFSGFKRAREFKVLIMQNVSVLQSAPTPSQGRATTTTLEDNFITIQRAEGEPWIDIAAHLNERRLSNNEAPTWTEAAVYSHFILKYSEIRSPTRDVGFEPRDYAHLRNAGSGLESSSKAGKKRVKDFQNATELSANIRKPASIADARGNPPQGTALVRAKSKGKGKGKDEERRKGELEDEIVTMNEEMAELLMRAVAKVERNFWVYVADEFEREAGKYVEPRDLESVFHSI